MLLLFAQLAVALFLLVLFPLVDIIFTIKYYNRCNMLSSLCTLNSLGILLKVPLCFISCIIGMLAISFELVLVKELGDNLKDLSALTSATQFTDPKHVHNLAPNYYHQIQIFTALVNESLQTFFWPVVEFMYTLSAIGLAYTLVKYHMLFNIFVNTIAAINLNIVFYSCYF